MKKKGKMFNFIFSLGVFEVVFWIKNFYEIKMNCMGFFLNIFMYCYFEYSNYWFKFFVVLNMLICNLNEGYMCLFFEKKVGIV